MGGDWQELAQASVIGLLFAFLVAKLISIVIAFREDNLRITRSPPTSPTPSRSSPAPPATPTPAAPPPTSRDGQDGASDGSDSDWEGVESTELDEEFSAASAFVAASAASGTSVPEEAQLRLYGLYKIATEGPCTAPQPSALKLKARAKWNAWHKLGAMPTEEAMQEYITIVDGLFPNWAVGSSTKNTTVREREIDRAMAAQAQPLMVPTDDELVQAQADLFRHMLYYLSSMSLRCAIKLGIPTAIHRLGSTASLPNLATALSLPPAKLPFLRRLMRLLVTSGVFAADDTTEVGLYRLTPLSCLLVDGVVADDGHTSQAPLVLAATSRHYMEAAMGLADWFSKDVALAPFEEVHGATLFDESMARKFPEFDKEVNESLAAHDNLGMGTVLRQCRDLFEGLQSLTDCCGGDGTMARAIVKAFPHIKCTVLDLPRVIGSVQADGVVNYVAGDMFKSIPAAQAVMLKLVLHHWSDEDCVKIMAQCKKAIPSREAGGKVIVIDIVIGSSSGPMLEAQLLMDIAMMVLTRGQQRDENDWHHIFIKAGFSDYKIIKKLGARGVIEVYP